MTQAQAPTEPPIIPHLTVSNAAAAIDFYKEGFGAVELGRMPAEGSDKIMHASLLINGSMVFLNDDFPEMSGGRPNTPEALGGSPVTIHLTMNEVDSAFDRALKAGATTVMPVADQFWGARYGVLQDPFGHQWSLGTPAAPQM